MGNLFKKAALIFFVALGLFAFLQGKNNFTDPDSFYHLKMAQSGVQKSFPYLQFTILKDNFTDQHLLYHFILPHTFLGAKIFTIVIAALFFAIFYFILENLKIKYALWWSLALLTAQPFVFRLSLTKASGLVLIFVFIILWALIKKKDRWLLPLGFVYVWLHGGFIILPILAVFLRRFKALFWGLLGIALGLVINPYFPQNFKFYWNQLVQIGIINYKDKIQVGAEWYSYHPLELISVASILFIILLLGITVFIIYNKKQDKISWGLLISSIFFLAITIKSRRYVEYFVPFSYLFAVFVLNNYFKNYFTEHWKKVLLFWREHKVLMPVLGVYLFLTLSFTVGRGVYINKLDLGERFDINLYKNACEYLKDNTQPGEIVFHALWDEAPMLFYHNSRNYYIVGLDATFMYKYDEAKYNLWHDIINGKVKKNLAKTIEDNFNSHYVFVSERDGNEFLEAFLKRDENAKIVYKDNEAMIFELR